MSEGKERRHAFRSFKERVDSMKIEPSRKLNTRAHDYVETSHFLATLEHWKEVNLSGDFTEFLREVEPICQTLPQILHHQTKIYSSLQNHILKNDVNSIQPLLELLAQFVHDLGPDFMQFYKEFLVVIMDIAQRTNPNDAQNMRNTSNVLEWCFNTLAFAFKYLSRVLAEDLVPTFEALLPILEMTKKTYVSRFCAEALSFLIKKSRSESLVKIVQFSFNAQRDSLEKSNFYKESLVILYSEAMKNTSETFHSKAVSVFSALLENALSEQSSSDACVGTLCDILVQISQHGSPQACEKFYRNCMTYLETVIEKTSSQEILQYVAQVLITMVFSESGKKVSDWPLLFKVIDVLVKKAELISGETNELSSPLLALLSHLFALIVRNCPTEHLSRHFEYMVAFLAARKSNRWFLGFYEISATNASEKLAVFSAKRTFQNVINKTTQKDELIYLAQKIAMLPIETVTGLVLPVYLTQQLLDMMETDIQSSVTETVLTKLFWKLRLLALAPENASNSLIPLRVMQAVSNSSLPQTPFLQDVLGTSMRVAVNVSQKSKESQCASEIFEILQTRLETSRGSLDFLVGATVFLEKHNQNVTSKLVMNQDKISHVLAQNFSSPDRKLRVQTAVFLIKLHEFAGSKASFILSQIRIIDEVPLTIANANDVKMRIRNLATEFSQLKEKSTTDCIQFASYVIGLLSNSFQPCWLAVYDALPQIAEAGCAAHLWRVLMAFAKLDYSTQNTGLYRNTDDSAFDYLEDMDVCVPQFEVLNDKLQASINGADAAIAKSENDALFSILESAKHKAMATSYSPQLRARVIQALKSITYVVEQHGEEFVEFLINLQESNDEDSDMYQDWTNKDRLAIVGVCGKFKKMRKIPRNETLFQFILENLSSKQTNVQQESLEVLFAWQKQAINKYRDNLKNLLEDKLFRDELQVLVNKNTDSKIEQSDEPDVIPIILRILYGRAKGASNAKSKNSRKFAVATILPNLPDAYIERFLAILSQQLGFDSFYATGELPEKTSKKHLNGMVGYLNMLYEVFNGLGYKFAHLLRHTIQPLAYTLLVSQKVIDESSGLEKIEESPDNIDNGDSINENHEQLVLKISRNVRSLGFRCLDHLFKITASVYDWNEEKDLIFNFIVKPRLPKFHMENAQQPSALMGLILGWVNSPNLVPLLYMDDYSAVNAVMGLLANKHAKDTVVSAILEFCIAAFTRKEVIDEEYYTFLALVVDGLLAVLPHVIEDSMDKEINSRASTLLLLIIEGGYVKEHATRHALVEACASAIKKPPTQIAINDRVSLLISLVSILDGFECTFAEIQPLFEVCASAFRSYKDRNIREALVQIFGVIGGRFDEFKIVSELLADLNAFSTERLREPDFERRLRAFKLINEDLYTKLTPLQWLPIVQACLFFINDPEEIAIRSNASHTLVSFIEGLGSKADEDVEAFKNLFQMVVVPHLRSGLKKDSDEIKHGYIHVLAAAVRNHKLFPEFASMQVLLSEDPDEDFFKNFTHIQLKCRQQAVRSLVDHKLELSPACLHHYILPMTESFTECTTEKLRALLDDTHATWGELVPRLNWDQFRQLFRRKINAAAVQANDNAYSRDRLRLVIHLSQGMLTSFTNLKEGKMAECFEHIPEDPVKSERMVLNEFFEPIMKTVRIRDDETVEDRTLLVEAAVNCILCVSEPTAEAAISGALTSTCQALRSRYQPTRDGIRKTLCKVARIVGAKYLKFLIKELKTALSRGAQIHVLSFTIHSVLAAVIDDLENGDLDDSAQLIVDIIMEDIFGAAGQDKDAEDYVSSMREVKSKKSFDTGELLCANISLNTFSYLVEPIKMLLKANIPLKTRRKLDELLRKYAQGLLHNVNAAKTDVLVLCYELHQQSTQVEFRERPVKATNDSEEHFLVRVSSKPTHVNVDKSQVVYALQKFSFELLRSALIKQQHLLTVANIDGFVPLFASSMEADDEGLLVSLFRILDRIVRLEFDETRDVFFTDSATRAFSVLENASSTSSDLGQTCLRYLASIVRYRPSVKLSDRALAYVLVKLMPDMEEPDQQSLAFNFLKAVLHQHVMLPEVYEVMDKVASIMVVNHATEIRSISRALYFQFLMEYEQGPAKLEKAFKFLVNNLAYPTQSGRESVMEVMNSIIMKAPEALLAQLATSFFVGLANVAVADDISKCREMAAALIGRLFKKVAQSQAREMESFIHAWMSQESNSLLRRCGLLVYKIHLSVFGYGSHGKLDALAHAHVEKVLKMARNNLDDPGKTSDFDTVEWEDVYTAMSVFSGTCSVLGADVLTTRFEGIWRRVLSLLLYPHTWVRLLASRLIGIILSNLDKVQFSVSNEQLQTIAYRLFRQLGAPVVAPELGLQAVKNVMQLASKWYKEKTPFYEISESVKMEKSDDAEEPQEKGEPDETSETPEPSKSTQSKPRYPSAIAFVLARVCSILRQDSKTDRLLVARKSAIQMGAVLAQACPKEDLPSTARQLLFGMYYILENDAYTDAENDVLSMAKESSRALEEQLGVMQYSEIFTSIRKEVDQKRLDRRVKKTQLALNAPDVAAQKKLRKNEKFREKRKRRKDATGLYKPKRTKKNEA